MTEQQTRKKEAEGKKFSRVDRERQREKKSVHISNGFIGLTTSAGTRKNRHVEKSDFNRFDKTHMHARERYLLMQVAQQRTFFSRITQNQMEYGILCDVYRWISKLRAFAIGNQYNANIFFTPFFALLRSRYKSLQRARTALFLSQRK